MKAVVLGLISTLIPASSFAGFPLLEFEDLSGSYANRRGQAFAKSASYDLDVVKVEHSELEVLFNNIDKNLVIQDTNTSVRLKMDFSFLNVFKSLSFEGGKIRSLPKHFHFQMEELSVFIAPEDYVLSEIKLSSDLTNLAGDISKIGVLGGLILDGEITIKELSWGASFLQAKELFTSVVSLKDLTQKEVADIPLVVRDCRLEMKDKKFVGTALLDSYLNAWLSFGGEIKHDSKKNMLYIEIKKAKLGVFSVRNILLQKIADLSLETVKVAGNVVIVDLDQVASAGRDSSKQ